MGTISPISKPRFSIRWKLLLVYMGLIGITFGLVVWAVMNVTGTYLVNQRVSEELSVVDALALEVGSPRVANVIVIGALIALTGLVTPEEFQRSLDLKFAKKSDAVRAMNAEALKRGIAAAQR